MLYVSGKARHSLPRTCRWSLTTLFSSPPTYWAGLCTRGRMRKIASLSELATDRLLHLRECKPARVLWHFRRTWKRESPAGGAVAFLRAWESTAETAVAHMPPPCATAVSAVVGQRTDCNNATAPP